MGKFQPIGINRQSALTTLGAKTAQATPITTDGASEGYHAKSMDISVVWENPTTGEGPIDVWVIDNDWSITEFEEYLEQTTGFDRGAQEIQARGRSMKHIGSLSPEENVLNGGDPLRVPLKLFIAEGHTLEFVMYNSGAAALTSGSVVNFSGKMWGNWAQ